MRLGGILKTRWD